MPLTSNNKYKSHEESLRNYNCSSNLLHDAENIKNLESKTNKNNLETINTEPNDSCKEKYNDNNNENIPYKFNSFIQSNFLKDHSLIERNKVLHEIQNSMTKINRTNNFVSRDISENTVGDKFRNENRNINDIEGEIQNEKVISFDTYLKNARHLKTQNTNIRLENNSSNHCSNNYYSEPMDHSYIPHNNDPTNNKSIPSGNEFNDPSSNVLESFSYPRKFYFEKYYSSINDKNQEIDRDSTNIQDDTYFEAHSHSNKSQNTETQLNRNSMEDDFSNNTSKEHKDISLNEDEVISHPISTNETFSKLNDIFMTENNEHIKNKAYSLKEYIPPMKKRDYSVYRFKFTKEHKLEKFETPKRIVLEREDKLNSIQRIGADENSIHSKTLNNANLPSHQVQTVIQDQNDKNKHENEQQRFSLKKYNIFNASNSFNIFHSLIDRNIPNSQEFIPITLEKMNKSSILENVDTLELSKNKLSTNEIIPQVLRTPEFRTSELNLGELSAEKISLADRDELVDLYSKYINSSQDALVHKRFLKKYNLYDSTLRNVLGLRRKTEKVLHAIRAELYNLTNDDKNQGINKFSRDGKKRNIRKRIKKKLNNELTELRNTSINHSMTHKDFENYRFNEEYSFNESNEDNEYIEDEDYFDYENLKYSTSKKRNNQLIANNINSMNIFKSRKENINIIDELNRIINGPSSLKTIYNHNIVHFDKDPIDFIKRKRSWSSIQEEDLINNCQEIRIDGYGGVYIIIPFIIKENMYNKVKKRRRKSLNPERSI